MIGHTHRVASLVNYLDCFFRVRSGNAAHTYLLLYVRGLLTDLSDRLILTLSSHEKIASDLHDRVYLRPEACSAVWPLYCLVSPSWLH
jgi:hypothetical protein